MSHTVRRVKIGKLYDGSSCCCCGDLLFFDDDGVICEACGSPSHIRCWDRVKRCTACSARGSYDIQSPPPQARTQVKQTSRRILGVGENFCATCGDIVSGYCFRCSNLYPQPAYTGPRETLPEATHALTLALIGLVCFGFVLGPIAIVKGTSAKKQIAADPTHDREAAATAAQIIGAIEILMSVLYLLRLIVTNT